MVSYTAVEFLKDVRAGIWRARSDPMTCPHTAGARLCRLTMPEIGTTHTHGFVDRAAGGPWVYRVAVAANWLDDPAYGDPFLVSRPVTVDMP